MTALFKSEIRITFKDLLIAQFVINNLFTPFNIFYILFSIVVIYEKVAPLDLGYDLLALFGILIAIHFFLIHVFVFIIGLLVLIFSSKKGILGIHQFIFYDQEFVESTSFNETRIKYETVSKVFNVFGYLIIRVPGLNYHFLPKRDFSNKEEYYELSRFLKEQMKYQKT